MPEDKPSQNNSTQDTATQKTAIAEPENAISETVESSARNAALPEEDLSSLKGEELSRAQYDDIVPGMTIRVHQKIQDVTAKGGERERVQFFEGIILARKHGRSAGATITVRKISHGVGVEKIFPVRLPTITKIEVLKKLKKRRRSKLFFLRSGYKKRLKEVRV